MAYKYDIAKHLQNPFNKCCVAAGQVGRAVIFFSLTSKTTRSRLLNPTSTSLSSQRAGLKRVDRLEAAKAHNSL